jgi:hypothetical protein
VADEQGPDIDACANMVVDHAISIDQEKVITVEQPDVHRCAESAQR